MWCVNANESLKDTLLSLIDLLCYGILLLAVLLLLLASIFLGIEKRRERICAREEEQTAVEASTTLLEIGGLHNIFTGEALVYSTPTARNDQRPLVIIASRILWGACWNW